MKERSIGARAIKQYESIRSFLATIKPISSAEDLAQIRHLARQGDDDSIMRLAICCAEGRGVDIDRARAKALLQKLDERDNPYAAYFLCRLFQHGVSKVANHRDKDRYYLQHNHFLARAENLGLPEALYELALKERPGKKRTTMLEEAARRGVAEASFALGCYLFEKNIAWNDDSKPKPVGTSGLAAREHFLRAADAGLPIAQTYMALLYSGVCRDICRNLVERNKWLEKAKTNDPTACSWMVSIYETRATTAALKKALDLYQRGPTQWGLDPCLLPPVVTKTRIGDWPSVTLADRLVETRIEAMLGTPHAVVAYALATDDPDWIEKGASLGDLECKRRLAAMALSEGAPSKMEELAISGDAEAMKLFGEWLFENSGEPEAQPWLEKSLENGAYPCPEYLLLTYVHVQEELASWLKRYIDHPTFDNNADILHAYAASCEYGFSIPVNINEACKYYLRAAYFGKAANERQWYLFLMRTNVADMFKEWEDDSDTNIRMPDLVSWSGFDVDALCRSPSPLSLVKLVLILGGNEQNSYVEKLAVSLGDRIAYGIVTNPDGHSILGGLFSDDSIYLQSWMFDFIGAEKPPSSLRSYRSFLELIERSLPPRFGDAESLRESWSVNWPMGYLLGVSAFDFQDDDELFQRWIGYLGFATEHSNNAAAILGYLHHSGRIRNASHKTAGEYFEKVIGEDDRNHRRDAVQITPESRDLIVRGWVLSMNASLRENQARLETERRMLSYLTHTLRNAFAAGPETARQTRRLIAEHAASLDSPISDKAIGNLALLESQLQDAQALIDKYRIYIRSANELQQGWRSEGAGKESAAVPLIQALKQTLALLVLDPGHRPSLNCLIADNSAGWLKRLRNSYIETVMPLEPVDRETPPCLFEWLSGNLPTVAVTCDPGDKPLLQQGGIRFNFLFSIFSELIHNALKCIDPGGSIDVTWTITKAGDYLFAIRNSFTPESRIRSSGIGSGKGLMFVDQMTANMGLKIDRVEQDNAYSATLEIPRDILEG